MKIIKPSYVILDTVNEERIVQSITRAGRICYKSEKPFELEEGRQFIIDRIKGGHESIIEHEKVTVKVICDRGVSHEVVRHRIASYSQSSTRYCNYSKAQFGNEITVIKPCFFEEGTKPYELWSNAIKLSEEFYFHLLKAGAQAQEARSVLPNSLMTEIIMTMNLREWRHFFRLRASKAAHPQMREIAVPMCKEFKHLLPCFFFDINLE